VRSFSSEKDVAASEDIYDVDEEDLVLDDPEVDACEDLKKEIMCAQTDDNDGCLTNTRPTNTRP
jgi:hypothetical protein